ncbi:hypothetical protein ACET3Z_026700 [Daucus carota]
MASAATQDIPEILTKDDPPLTAMQSSPACNHIGAVIRSKYERTRKREGAYRVQMIKTRVRPPSRTLTVNLTISSDDKPIDVGKGAAKLERL